MAEGSKGVNPKKAKTPAKKKVVMASPNGKPARKKPRRTRRTS